MKKIDKKILDLLIENNSIEENTHDRIENYITSLKPLPYSNESLYYQMEYLERIANMLGLKKAVDHIKSTKWMTK